jgi:hypothetical protein
MMRASTYHVTRLMILNIVKIRIKNDTIVMVSNLPVKHKLHGQVENKRNIINMKRVRAKSALPNNSKRGFIDNVNSEIARRTQRRKTGEMRHRVKSGIKIKNSWTSTWRMSRRWSYSGSLRISSRTYNYRRLSHITNGS